MPHSPLDETPVTLTLPAYQWAALRGAARRCASQDLRKAGRRERDLPPDGIDLDSFRARTLESAAGTIDAALGGADHA